MADIVYTIGGDASEFQKAIKDAMKEAAGEAVTVGKIFRGAFLAEEAVKIFNKALSATVDVMKAAITSASEYDDSLNQLNVALAASGSFSEQASMDFQEFAQSIQETTKFSDDAVLSSAALLAQMTRLSNEGVKEATRAALDLSAAYKIDLDSATRLVARAAEGNISAFSKMGITIQKGTTDAETFANTLKALSGIQGTAENTSNTFDGSLTKLHNSFSDTLKTIGQYITRSPAVITLFNSIASSLNDISKSIKEAFGNKDIMKDLIINMAVFAQTAVMTFNQVTDAASAYVKIIAAAGYAVVGLKTHNRQMLTEAKELFLSSAESAKRAFNPNQQTPFLLALDKVIQKIAATKGALNGLTEDVKNKGKETAEQIQFVALVFQQGVLDNISFFGVGIGFIAETSIQQMERMKSVALQVGQSINQAFTKVAADGIQRLTKTLISGKSAFGDFGKFILKTMGELATQIGMVLLSAGIGMLALKFLDPTGAIIAGAALIALGTILSSMGEGGSAAAAGGGAGGGGFSSADAVSGEDVTELEPRKPETHLTVNVQGNILDRRQTGLEIAEVIQETFGSNGINFSTA